MSNHTPGPWTVRDDGDELFVHGPIHNGVASGVLSYDVENGLEIFNDADKALMFAAPDLLEACEMLIGTAIGAGREHAESVSVARAAIAKARGNDA